MRALNVSLVALVLLGADLAAQAADRPRWEVGLGAGAVTLPDYRGAKARSSYLLPLPYVTYRGDVLEIDRDGLRGGLFSSERLRLDFSLAAAPPARRDAGARRGMPDLDPAIEFGPALIVGLGRQPASRWSLHLPLRAVVATDLRQTQSIGWVFSPYVKYAVTAKGGWESDVSIGPIYASQAYHDYYYEVAPRFATPTRPAYDADAGYSGTRLTFSLSRRYDRYWIGLFARYDNLSGVAFRSSPLVETEQAFIVGGGIAWIVARAASQGPPPRGPE